MKRRIIIALAIVLVVVPMSGAEKWGDFYKRGLEAVNSREWATVKSSMESAIALKPVAQSPVRWKKETLTYIPHFYLGIAKFQLGDIDGALDAFKTSQSHGVIQRTEYWADQRRWVARAQQEKGKVAREAASDTRRAADTAINNATMAQAGAIAAGADRSEDFRKGKRLLTDAISSFDKTGVDQAAYRNVEKKANEARALFEAAGKAVRKRDVRPVRPVTPKPVVDPAKAAEEAERTRQLEELRTGISGRLSDLNGQLDEAEDEYADAAEFQTFVQNTRSQADQWEAMLATTEDPAELQKVKQSVSASLEELGQQTAALRAVKAAKAEPPPPVPEKPAPVEVITRARADLERAWAAYARGDVDACESIADGIVSASVSSGDAYMLRGIARYTRAMLSDQRDLLDSAAADFAAAVRLNPSVKMDKRYFSPKLISFFNQIKGSIGG